MANYSIPFLSEDAISRFWSKVQKGGPDECWLWKDSLTDKGYGIWRPYLGAKSYRVHRISYFIETGIDLGDRNGLHSCDVRACCNPAHTFPGTQTDNLVDMRAKGRGYTFPVLYGTEAPNARISEEDKAEMRRLAELTPRRPEGHGRRIIPGYWSEKRLAEKFGCSKTQVGRIIKSRKR